jgi:predicted secreted Zn-dependent protease
MRWHSGAFLAAVACVCLTGQAEARPKATTKYSYYTISGSSAVDLYNAMIRRGPHVNGSKAYASTSASSSQQGILEQGKSCRVKNYKFSIDFTIRLPKFANEAKLPSETRKRWRAFSAFLRQHEETHRKIWLDCGTDLEAKIATIRAKDCNAADRQAAKMWDQMRASCARRHAVFDATEQKRLLKHPFVKLVLNGAARTSHAAAAKPRKSKAKKKKKNFASSG